MNDRDHEVFCMIMTRLDDATRLADTYGIGIHDAKSVLDIHCGDMDAAKTFLDGVLVTDESTTKTHEEVYSFFIN